MCEKVKEAEVVVVSKQDVQTTPDADSAARKFKPNGHVRHLNILSASLRLAGMPQPAKRRAPARSGRCRAALLAARHGDHVPLRVAQMP